MERGANVTFRDERGRTALHHAVESQLLSVVQDILRCGADVNAQDIEGTTPLHLAVDKGWDAIVVALLAFGADANMRISSSEAASALY